MSKLNKIIIDQKYGESLKKRIEESEDNWNKWTLTRKKYSLITKIAIIDNDLLGNKTSGDVTQYIDFCIGADNIETLVDLWLTDYFYQRYDTTTQHFIIDNELKAVVKFLSLTS